MNEKLDRQMRIDQPTQQLRSTGIKDGSECAQEVGGGEHREDLDEEG